MGRLQPLPVGTWQTGFTCPRPEEATNPTPHKGRREEFFPNLPPILKVASFFFYPTLPKPRKARTRHSSWSGTVSSAACETVQPKTQTPASDLF